MKKRTNPLSKRIVRELKDDFTKYIVIFLLLALTIGLVSGFLVADNSMITAYNDSFEKYNIEDGHFQTEIEIDEDTIRDIESLDVSLYNLQYVQESIDNGSNLRIYADSNYSQRDKVDKVCLMSGKMPQKDGEIAIDRMYADNNGFEVGDKIKSENRSWKITGLVALSDYSCLFENNNDSMFDSLLFGVAIVSDDEFASFEEKDIFYNYAWKYDKEPDNKTEEKELSDEFMKSLSQKVVLKDYVPRYLNQAINFTGTDMGSDKTMMIMLLYIMIIIMAFVFAITTSNTIVKEANVIGTLRASGYTRGELIRHYMTTPILVTLIGALVGNILGYTFFKNVIEDLYYSSYSLTKYTLKLNPQAFLQTTIGPIIIMLVINWFILRKKLKISPQQFLRRDLSKKTKKGAMHLSHSIPFMSRFRIRVLLQNRSSYTVLAVGIFFANLLLLFGMGFPALLDNFKDNITSSMFCKYQYMLDIPTYLMSDDALTNDAQSEDKSSEQMAAVLAYMDAIETENKDAEKFSAYSLKTKEKENYRVEDIIVYGIEPDSRYIDLDVEDGKVFVSSAYADKYGKEVGDTVTMKEEFEDKEYSFKIDGVYKYDNAVSIFMSREKLNESFGFDKEMFVGYFSDSPITDIDDEYIGTVIDENAMTKVSRQLEKSMGSMMTYVDIFAIVIFIVLMYLLSKIIIERNAQSISMAKILGYKNGEIAKLYILPTTVVTLLFILISLPIEKFLILKLFHYMLLVEMSGWIPLDLSNMILVKMFFVGVLTYAVVAVIELRRLKRVPMEDALKNVE